MKILLMTMDNVDMKELLAHATNVKLDNTQSATYWFTALLQETARPSTQYATARRTYHCILAWRATRKLDAL